MEAGRKLAKYRSIYLKVSLNELEHAFHLPVKAWPWHVPLVANSSNMQPSRGPSLMKKVW